MPIGSVYTRAELRERLRDELQLPASAGAATDERANRSLQYALSQVWDRLVASDQGVGVVSTILTVLAPGDPSGLVPGESLPLPVDFRRLLGVYEHRRQLCWASPTELFRLRQEGAALGVRTQGRVYGVSGPGQTAAPAVSSARLELYPDVVEGDSIALLYATQPPSLGDPADVGDDTIEVDLLHDPVVRVVIARAGLRLLARGDQAGRDRLAQEVALAEAEFDPARSRRDGGVRRL